LWVKAKAKALEISMPAPVMKAARRPTPTIPLSGEWT